MRGESAAFRMGLIPITAAGHASWALGVSKSMLDDVTDLAATKVRMGDEARWSTAPPSRKVSPTMWPCGRRPGSLC